MFRNDFGIFTTFNWPRDVFEVTIYRQTNDESIEVVTDVTLTEQRFSSVPDKVTPIIMSRESIQKLFDSLWAAGVRPTDAGSKNDTIHVLQDDVSFLRTLVTKYVDHLKK